MTLSDGVAPEPAPAEAHPRGASLPRREPDRDVDLRTIAREASLSPYYSPGSSRVRRRAAVPRYHRSADRSREGSRCAGPSSPSRTSHRVGSTPLSHFTTTFRQHTGLSPLRLSAPQGLGAEAFRFASITDTSIHQPNKRMSL
jgi:hypothetical protein